MNLTSDIRITNLSPPWTFSGFKGQNKPVILPKSIYNNYVITNNIIVFRINNKRYVTVIRKYPHTIYPTDTSIALLKGIG